MRWCAALAVVLVALVVMTVKTIRRPHKRAAPVEPELVELAPPVRPPPALSSAPSRRPSSGIAHLRGRVVPPAGRRGDGLVDVKVTADDGRRTFNARTTKGGGFMFHMPPGRYVLTAWADDLVGELRDVFVASDADREVEISLVAAAKIAGALHAPDDADVTVVAWPMGSERGASEGGADDGAFEIEGLIPGRRYDVVFAGSDVRTLKLVGVLASSEGLDVKLEARAVVHVAVGFPLGERCPINLVTARAGDDEDEASTSSDALTCRFDLTAPVDAGELTVVAEGHGWLLETSVTIPAHGDPEPVCLNPPCRENPLEGSARLRLALDGAGPESSIIAAVVSVNDEDAPSHGCGGSAGRCDIAGLRPGETFSIRARGDGCRADPMTVTVVAGDNHVRLPCRRERRIEGVIRVPEGQEPDSVVVRCAGGDSHPLSDTRLFRITCGEDVNTLEYQIGTNGTWRSIPIASLSGPAFVDIGPF